jgi:HPt (histidine-containing phosphotransfer) domain-containing protein
MDGSAVDNSVHEDPAIDDEAFAAMKSAMGEIFAEVIETFLNYIPGQIDQLGAAIVAGDLREIFNLAHSIKCSSGSIGALGVASVAARIEQLGRSNDLGPVAHHYASLQRKFKQTEDFLTQSLGHK